MASFKFYVKPLNKTFTVTQSVENWMASLDYEIGNAELLESNTDEIGKTESVVDQLKHIKKVGQSLYEFPANVLGLTDKQVDKLKKIDREQLTQLNESLAARLQGATEEDVQAFKSGNEGNDTGTKKDVKE